MFQDPLKIFRETKLLKYMKLVGDASCYSCITTDT